ncbi:ergothioneine biosynthesis protein EgtC [Dactylosporangium sp. NPDC051541]|uniref:ergothioneine biosynthesis protein EgtC n=1 Tax=Dactylosporangium sp. NPDC051541 TaxID=3363977 RepID=UPI00378E8CE8
MCRHLAYLGPPIRLADLLFTPPHSLERQSWAPQDMRGGGTINADGFGVGWLQDQTPLVYRRSVALWTDAALPQLAAATRSGAVLAAVRSATVGMPVVETAAAPFCEGRWLFSHNGKVTGWPDSVTALAAGLPVRDLLTLDAPTDSALLWALVRARLRAGAAPPDALGAVVAAVRAAAPGSRLNLLLTDGDTIAATTVGHSLSYLATGDGAVLVASEPLSPDPAWKAVPDLSLLVAAPSAVTVIALEGTTS